MAVNDSLSLQLQQLSEKQFTNKNIHHQRRAGIIIFRLSVFQLKSFLFFVGCDIIRFIDRMQLYKSLDVPLDVVSLLETVRLAHGQLICSENCFYPFTF